MSKKIAIIGAGLSGSLLASKLNHNFEVTVFDKARGCGGRTSRLIKDSYNFDKGCQFFEIQNKTVLQELQAPLNKNIIVPFSKETLVFHQEDTLIIQPTLFTGKVNLNNLIKFFLKDVNVSFNNNVIDIDKKNLHWFITTDKKICYGPFDVVIMSQPAPQVLNIAPNFAELLNNITYSSSLVLYLALKKTLSNQFKIPIIDEHSLIKSIIQKEHHPANISQSTLTIQSKPIDPTNINSDIHNLILKIINDSEIILNQKLSYEIIGHHLWRYSECLKTSNINSIWDHKSKLGVIGDGLVEKSCSGIESAVLSSLNFIDRFNSYL